MLRHEILALAEKLKSLTHQARNADFVPPYMYPNLDEIYELRMHALSMPEDPPFVKVKTKTFLDWHETEWNKNPTTLGVDFLEKFSCPGWGYMTDLRMSLNNDWSFAFIVDNLLED